MVETFASSNCPSSIVNYVENEIFLVYGVPQYITVDNAPNFAGGVFRKLCDDYKVQKIIFNTRYHPQFNQAERVNHTLNTAICSFIKDKNYKDWDKEIPKITHTLRVATHEVTGHIFNFCP